QLVKRIVSGLVHAWMLARGTDEQSREQVRQRRMVVPVREQTAQQIRAPQDRAFARGGRASYDVMTAARAGVAAIQHELLGPEPRPPRFFVQGRRLPDELVP